MDGTWPPERSSQQHDHHRNKQTEERAGEATDDVRRHSTTERMTQASAWLRLPRTRWGRRRRSVRSVADFEPNTQASTRGYETAHPIAATVPAPTPPCHRVAPSPDARLPGGPFRVTGAPFQTHEPVIGNRQESLKPGRADVAKPLDE